MSWFWPDLEEVFFVQPFTGGLGQDVSYELNKSILA